MRASTCSRCARRPSSSPSTRWAAGRGVLACLRAPLHTHVRLPHRSRYPMCGQARPRPLGPVQASEQSAPVPRSLVPPLLPPQVDRLYDWKTVADSPIRDAFKRQKESVLTEFEQRSSQVRRARPRAWAFRVLWAFGGSGINGRPCQPAAGGSAGLRQGWVGGFGTCACARAHVAVQLRHRCRGGELLRYPCTPMHS